jgi:hypothetical protein
MIRTALPPPEAGRTLIMPVSLASPSSVYPGHGIMSCLDGPQLIARSLTRRLLPVMSKVRNPACLVHWPAIQAVLRHEAAHHYLASGGKKIDGVFRQ